MKVGRVTGKITYKGAPVTGGLVTLSPTGSDKEPGKPGAGAVNADGSFTITTYKENDGAVVGKHRVTYQPPPSEAASDPEKPLGPDESPPLSPFAGKNVNPSEVEIKSGSNQVDIELVDPK